MEIARNYILDLMRKEGIVAVYAEGEYLYQQGESASYLFYVRNGSIVITEAQDPKLVLARFSMGGVLGAPELITGAAYRFNAISEEPSTLFKMEKTKFDDLFRHDSQFRINMVKLVSSGMIERRGQHE